MPQRPLLVPRFQRSCRAMDPREVDGSDPLFFAKTIMDLVKKAYRADGKVEASIYFPGLKAEVRFSAACDAGTCTFSWCCPDLEPCLALSRSYGALFMTVRVTPWTKLCDQPAGFIT